MVLIAEMEGRAIGGDGDCLGWRDGIEMRMKETVWTRQ